MDIPSVLIIGQQKAATTSLFSFLKQTRLYNSSINKETPFFVPGYQLDFSNFPSYFVDPGSSKPFLSSTPQYSFNSSALLRFLKEKPCTHLIYIIRDPLSRLISQFRMLSKLLPDYPDINLLIKKELSNTAQDTPLADSHTLIAGSLLSPILTSLESGGYLPQLLCLPFSTISSPSSLLSLSSFLQVPLSDLPSTFPTRMASNPNRLFTKTFNKAISSLLNFSRTLSIHARHIPLTVSTKQYAYSFINRLEELSLQQTGTHPSLLSQDNLLMLDHIFTEDTSTSLPILNRLYPG